MLAWVKTGQPPQETAYGGAPPARAQPASGSSSNARAPEAEAAPEAASAAPEAVDLRVDGSRGLETRGLRVYTAALDRHENILRRVRPAFIVMYDPDLAFLREVETYQAEWPQTAVKVFYLVYQESLEEQKFLSSTAREKRAFEELIHTKARMAKTPMEHQQRSLVEGPEPLVPLGLLSNSVTRVAGGRALPNRRAVPTKIVIDIREFMSSLPAVLYTSGLQLAPMTLEVGDYILSPECCVERKAVPDLISSLASGRLYNQAEAMCKYYKLPILLIEFEAGKSFSLMSASEITEDIMANSVVSKLALLLLHFPRLRLVWSRSLHATAEIFASLKSNQDEPDPQAAAKVGVISDENADVLLNETAVEMLRRLPGINEFNYRSVIRRCESLADLGTMSMEEIQEMLDDKKKGKTLYDFLHAKCPTVSTA